MSGERRRPAGENVMTERQKGGQKLLKQEAVKRSRSTELLEARNRSTKEYNEDKQ